MEKLNTYFKTLGVSLLFCIALSTSGQVRIEMEDSLFNPFLENSMRLGEINNPEEQRMFVVRRIFPTDTIRSTYLSDGVYLYREMSIHTNKHIFIVKNQKLSFPKDENLETIVNFLVNYCKKIEGEIPQYECFDILWQEVRSRITVAKYKQ